MSFLRIDIDAEAFRRKLRAAGATGRTRIVPAIRVEVDEVTEGARRDWPTLSGRSRNSIRTMDTDGGARTTSDVPYTVWVRPRGSGTETAWEDLVVRPMGRAYDRLVRVILPAIVREVLRGG